MDPFALAICQPLPTACFRAGRHHVTHRLATQTMPGWQQAWPTMASMNTWRFCPSISTSFRARSYLAASASALAVRMSA